MVGRERITEHDWHDASILSDCVVYGRDVLCLIVTTKAVTLTMVALWMLQVHVGVGSCAVILGDKP